MRQTGRRGGGEREREGETRRGIEVNFIGVFTCYLAK